MTAQIKLDRADAHIAEAGEIVDDWLNHTDAFTIEPVIDLATQRTEERVRLREQPPDRLALVIGDAVHNLRVALDHAVFDAARRAAYGPLSPEVERALMFPVHATRAAFNKKAPSRLVGVPDAVKQVIEDVQPFRWEREPDMEHAYRVWPLWRLNELDIIDKHRRLTVTAASLRHQAIGVPAEFEPETRFWFASGPVRDGHVLVSYLGRDAGVEHMVTRDVALVEPTLEIEAPVMDLLTSLQRETTNIVWRMDLAQRERPDD